MSEPASGLGKAAIAPALKLFAAVRREAARRNADIAAIDFTSLAKEMEEALDVLAGGADRPGKALLDFAKGIISGRPSYFDTQPIAAWIRTEKTQSLIKRSVEAMLAQKPIAAFAEEAVEFFNGFDGAEAADCRGAFDYAVAFVALSLIRDMTVGDRIVLAAIEALPGRIQGGVPSARARRLIDAEVERQSEHIRRGRFFSGFPTQVKAEDLAAHLLEGDFAGASQSTKARALARCARWQALKADPAKLQTLLDAANLLESTEDAVIAAAFLAGRANWKDGLRALAPIENPPRRAAAFQMAVNGSSPAEALQWFAETEFSTADLDSDGRQAVLTCRLVTGDWDGAYRDTLLLSDADFLATPALENGAALARLGQVVAPDQRSLIANGTPLDAATFRLADDEASLAERREASRRLRGTEKSALEFGNIAASRSAANTALWLELRDPATASNARTQLEGLLSDPDQAVTYLPLGLVFGIHVDRDSIERALTRRAALDPDGSVEVALARLALANSEHTAAEAADYIGRHRDVMWQHLNQAGLLEIEVRILAAANRLELAHQQLADFGDVLDPIARARLDAVLAQGEAGPSTADLEAAFERDPNINNLTSLVTHLSEQGFSSRFFALARQMVLATRARVDAENLVRFLLTHDRHDEIASILAEIPEIVTTSPDLRSALAWSLYRDGHVGDASALCSELLTEREEVNDRNLWVNILISAGRWPELTTFVEGEWTARDRRSAGELHAAAQIAEQVGSPRLGGLLAIAAEKGHNNPEVLLGCYMLAMRIGREADLGAQRWFADAAELSGEDGPVQSASLEEMMADAPDWDRHVEEVWEKVRLGEAPISVAAQLLRRPSLELLLATMIANRDASDPRRRAIISAFSGVRETPSREAETIGLDGSAIVTLATLDILGTLIAGPATVTIPHTTLGWLFTERQRLGFHQPSRTKAAHGLIRAITAGRLAKFVRVSKVNGALSDLVGRSLAAMLVTAAEDEGDAKQRLVIRSAPVHKIGSFRGEVADLAEYQPQLCSCQAVVDKLAARGQLTQEEEARARAYLTQHEERWADEPRIDDGALLYLDDLSVSYFRTTGLLDKLDAAGLVAFVPEREVDEARELVELESRSEEIEMVIERIRGDLAEGLASGTVRLDRTVTDDALRSHPNLTVIQMAPRVDAIVSDDRYMNQHRNLDHPDGSAEMWTSLDLLAMLEAAGQITREDLWRHRTTMRQCGFALVPSDADELQAFVERSRTNQGELVETGELKAFRENLLLGQQRRWLHLPRESHWLNKLVSDVVITIKAQWSSSVPDEDARARSRWLLRCADMRNWAGTITDNDGSSMARYGLAVAINSLVMSRFDIPDDDAERLDLWLSEEVIASLRSEEPAIYDWLLGNLREILAEHATRKVGND